jgi:hypothetical protein
VPARLCWARAGRLSCTQCIFSAPCFQLHTHCIPLIPSFLPSLCPALPCPPVCLPDSSVPSACLPARLPDSSLPSASPPACLPACLIPPCPWHLQACLPSHQFNPPSRIPTQAYFKMNNVLIDDRRIKVDFSQSVSHLWKQFKRHGRKGNADLAGEADGHQRQQAGAGGSGRIELKEQFLPMGGRGGGGGGRYGGGGGYSRGGGGRYGGGGGGYSLVLGDEGEERAPQQVGLPCSQGAGGCAAALPGQPGKLTDGGYGLV